jgi:hypothetical protein
VPSVGQQKRSYLNLAQTEGAEVAADTGSVRTPTMTLKSATLLFGALLIVAVFDAGALQRCCGISPSLIVRVEM